MPAPLPHPPLASPPPLLSLSLSRRYCPYCDLAKRALAAVGAKPFIVELDERNDGSAIQQELGRMTGGSSVPRVFIKGAFIGGGDDTEALRKSGKLAKMLE